LHILEELGMFFDPGNETCSNKGIWIPSVLFLEAGFFLLRLFPSTTGCPLDLRMKYLLFVWKIQ
jgi:hypothetical protein